MSAGTTFTSSGRDAELVGDELRVLGVLPVGLRRQAEHHLAGRVHAQKDCSVGLVSHGSHRLLGRGRPPGAAAPGGRSARCAPPGRRRRAAVHPAGSEAPRAARSPGRCRSSGSVIGHPAGRGLAPARSVAARHRDRAARNRRGAGPGLLLPASGGRRRLAAPRPAPIASATSSRASKLWPLTSASQYGSAALMPPDCTEKASGADARIDPHDPVGQAREALQLAAHEHRVAALPAVGEDHDHGAAGHPAASVPVVELAGARLRSWSRSTSPARRLRRAGSRARGSGKPARASAGSAAWRTRTPRRSARCPRRRSGTAGRRGRRAPSSLRCRTASPACGGRPAGAGERGGSGRRPCAGWRAGSGAGRCAPRGALSRSGASAAAERPACSRDIRR